MSDTSTEFKYPYNPEGNLPECIIENELATITYVDENYIFVVPRQSPFFKEDLIIHSEILDRNLVIEEDYILSHKFAGASKQLEKDIYGSITLIGVGRRDVLHLTYSTLGGDYTYRDQDALRSLTGIMTGQRYVNWDDIVDPPHQFPPVEHLHDAEDIKDMDDVVDALDRISDLISGETHPSHRHTMDKIDGLVEALAKCVSNDKNIFYDTIDPVAIKGFEKVIAITMPASSISVCSVTEILINDGVKSNRLLAFGEVEDGKGVGGDWKYIRVISDNDNFLNRVSGSYSETGNPILYLESKASAWPDCTLTIVKTVYSDYEDEFLTGIYSVQTATTLVGNIKSKDLICYIRNLDPILEDIETIGDLINALDDRVEQNEKDIAAINRDLIFREIEILDQNYDSNQTLYILLSEYEGAGFTGRIITTRVTSGNTPFAIYDIQTVKSNSEDVGCYLLDVLTSESNRVSLKRVEYKDTEYIAIVSEDYPQWNSPTRGIYYNATTNKFVPIITNSSDPDIGEESDLPDSTRKKYRDHYGLDYQYVPKLLSTDEQGTEGNSLTRKDWVDDNKVDKAGSTMTGDLHIDAHLTSKTKLLTPDSSLDFDDFILTASYDLPNLNDSKNKPPLSHCLLEVFGNPIRYVTQVATERTTAKRCFRTGHKNGSADRVWSDWVFIYSEVNKPTKSDVGLGNVDNVKQLPIAGGTATGSIIIDGATIYPDLTLKESDVLPSGWDDGMSLSRGTSAGGYAAYAVLTTIKAKDNRYTNQSFIYRTAGTSRMKFRVANEDGDGWEPMTEVYSTSFKPTKSDVGLGNVDNVKQVPLAGGTMTGGLIINEGGVYPKDTAKDADELRSEYPDGISMCDVAAKEGYPGNHQSLVSFNISTHRCLQLLAEKYSRGLYYRTVGDDEDLNEFITIYSDDYKPIADKWTTGRKITFTGDITGSVTIDGGADVSVDIEADSLGGILTDHFIYGDASSGTTTHSDLDAVPKSGFYRTSKPENGPVDDPSGGWFWYLNISHSATDLYNFQLATENNSTAGRLWFRSTNSSGEGDWTELYSRRRRPSNSDVGLGNVDNVKQAPNTRKINTTAPLSGGGDLSADRTLKVADATVDAKGVTQLYDTTDSTSTTLAATANAVKRAYDRGSSALSRSIRSPSSLNDTDLNTLNESSHCGVYYQSSNSNTPDLNYPEEYAGSLVVYRAAGIVQVYRLYHNSKEYQRSFFSEKWTDWVLKYDKENKPTKSDVGLSNVDNVKQAASALKINTTAPLSGGGDLSADRTLKVTDATVDTKGVSQLSDATNSTSTVLAATANAAKKAYDRGSSGITKADAAQADVDAHIAKKDNPHATTKSHVGLSNVDNVKQAASTRKINTTAPLSGGGDLSADRTLKVADATTSAKGVSQLNDATNSTSTAQAATANAAKKAYDRGSSGITKADAAQASTDAHIAKKDNPHAVTKSQVELSNVDNVKQAPSTRKINTTAPLKGGGDLSADRTLSIEAASISAVGVVQLTNDLTSTSITRAATGDALRRVNDNIATTPSRTVLATGAGSLTLSESVLNFKFIFLAGTTNNAFPSLCIPREFFDGDYPITMGLGGAFQQNSGDPGRGANLTITNVTSMNISNVGRGGASYTIYGVGRL